MAELTRTCAAEDCPGHALCSMCRADKCQDCGGCACASNPCGWVAYKPDCPSVYDEDCPVCDGTGGDHKIGCQQPAAMS